MKRPWQIWTVFGVALSVALGIMAWLTYKAIALDRAEVAVRAELDLARRQAELDDRISQALWRMDTALAPLIAQEAVRPANVYEPILTVRGGKGTGKGDAVPTLSPIIEQPSPFVLLNFQCSSAGNVTSPQSPEGTACAVAVDNGGSIGNIKMSAARLETLREKLDAEKVDAEKLLAMLPNETLAATANNSRWNLNPNVQQAQNSAYVVNRDLQDQGQTSGRNSIDEVLPPPAVLEQTPAQPPVRNRAPGRQTAQSPAVQQQRLEGDEDFQQEVSPYQGSPNQSAQQAARSANDLASRDRSLQNYTQQADIQQRLQVGWNTVAFEGSEAVMGVSRPLWIGDQLILARRVTRGGELLIQGVWLDWPALKAWLTSSTTDLLPEMSLLPVEPRVDVSTRRLLATLPVELVVPALVADPASVAPLGLPLVVAWSSLALAALAVAALLFGVVRLSERRAAFVSAVTHELRTPLTTFRLYTDMLSQGLVTDEKRRGEYMHTLHAEADRLGHLVENVLSFARLERRNQMRRRETTTIGRLLDDAVERLKMRAAQAELTIEVDVDPSTRATTVLVDPAAVEQILFNLVDNACKYAAAATDRRLHVSASANGQVASIRVRDHGPGIPASLAREVFRPFSRPADNAHPNVPGVGLGLALCRRLARSMKGELELVRRNDGAEFEMRLPLG